MNVQLRRDLERLLAAAVGKSTSSRVEGGYARPDLPLTEWITLVMLTHNCPGN